MSGLDEIKARAAAPDMINANIIDKTIKEGLTQ